MIIVFSFIHLICNFGIFSWLRTNNPIFAKMESVENCPTPILLEDDEGIDEESEDATVENHVDIQY